MKGKNLTVDESIRIEAYLLSEKAGHPSGMEHYFWTEATAIVHARATAVATAVKKAAARPKAKAKAPVAKAKPKAETKPKVVAKAKAEAKGKAVKKPALNGANGKDHQLSLGGEMTLPARKRTLKK